MAGWRQGMEKRFNDEPQKVFINFLVLLRSKRAGEEFSADILLEDLFKLE